MNETFRIWRSPYSSFGQLLKAPDDMQDETITAFQAYDDDTLESIAKSGFNAIWVYGLLQNIVPSDIFPEFGNNSAIHLNNMRQLIKNAGKYGIKVFILMQPPRALDVENIFWEKNIDIGGHEIDFITDDGFHVSMRSLCTSTKKVKDYLYNSSAKLAEELPDLKGVILITSSEFPSHCYGKTGTLPDEFGNLKKIKVNCTLCSKRHPDEVISEIIHLIRDGIKSVIKEQKIIAWNWSWNAHYKPPCREIIEKLPKDVIIMAGFERGGKKTILGKERVIDEYSLSFVGPSEQFICTSKSAKKNGLKMMAKLQIGTTHELATVPNLPLVANLYEKAKAMKKLNILNFMGCWNFGNMISVNTDAFSYFMMPESSADKQEALTEFAEYYFSKCKAKLIVQAWETFSESMDNYPFSTPLLYSGPLNYTLVYPLSPSPVGNTSVGRSWLMDNRGDNLDNSLTEFNIHEVIKGLELTSKKWKEGVDILKMGLEISKCDHSREELSNALACYHIFRSAWNTYRTYKLRSEWSEQNIAKYLNIIEDELENLKQVLPIIKNDKRLGFHSEAQNYMFNATGIKGKMNTIKSQIKQIKNK